MSTLTFGAELSLYRSGRSYRAGGTSSTGGEVQASLRPGLRAVAGRGIGGRAVIDGGGYGISEGCVAACATACAAACIGACVWNPFGSGCAECVDKCMDYCADDC
jgi:hypothetical protein